MKLDAKKASTYITFYFAFFLSKLTFFNFPGFAMHIPYFTSLEIYTPGGCDQ